MDSKLLWQNDLVPTCAAPVQVDHGKVVLVQEYLGQLELFLEPERQ